MLEPRIEPPERKDQARINYLHDMQDAEFEIGAFLEEYKKYSRRRSGIS